MFTDAELDYLKGIVCSFINEGSRTPPYDPELYSIIRELDIRQDEVDYDIAPPAPEAGQRGLRNDRPDRRVP